MIKTFLCLILILSGTVRVSGQNRDTLSTITDTLPDFDLETLSDTLIPNNDRTEETFSIPASFMLSELKSQTYNFSSIPWNSPREQVEALLALRGFVPDTLDRWITQVGSDTLWCYPGYENDRVSVFQIVYYPGDRSEKGLLDRYRKISRILTDKYGNPSYISVYDVKQYSPEKPFYTQKWISGKELLVTSINRSDRTVNIQYFYEPDSVVKKKNDYEKRLQELF